MQRYYVVVRFITVALFSFFLLVPFPVLATENDTASLSSTSQAPWRGSEFVFRNSLGALGLDRSADLTYNPTYTLGFTIAPRWWFGEVWNLRARLDINQELTDADDTTYYQEALVDDVILTGGASKFVTIPGVGIDVSADLRMTLPASKASQARTMILGLGSNIRLARTFDVLKGLTVGYFVQPIVYFHRMTTSEYETPLIVSCQSSAEGCDAFLNTGLRNKMVRLIHGPDLSLAFTDWLEFGFTFWFIQDWLYPIEKGDPRISYDPQESNDQRFNWFLEAAVTFTPWKFLRVGVGYTHLLPQLGPDSNYYNPIANRYSTIFVDLTLVVEEFVTSMIQMSEQ